MLEGQLHAPDSAPVPVHRKPKLTPKRIAALEYLREVRLTPRDIGMAASNSGSGAHRCQPRGRAVAAALEILAPRVCPAPTCRAHPLGVMVEAGVPEGPQIFRRPRHTETLETTMVGEEANIAG
jgi:hypothetical protein